MTMTRLILVCSVSAVCMLAAGIGAADREKSQIEKLMAAAHTGKTAPLANVKKQLGEATPAWPAMKKDAEAFVGLGAELVKVRGEKNRAALNYRDAAQELASAVEKQQLTDATTAFRKLTRTCASCHYGKVLE
jgi:hypothetical protein